MIPIWRKEHIEEALKKAQALVAAANGENSSCSCFDYLPFDPHLHIETVTKIKDSVRIYVDSWIIPELKKALQEKQYYSP